MLGLLGAANDAAREYGQGLLYSDAGAHAGGLGMGGKSKKVKMPDGNGKDNAETENEEKPADYTSMLQACHISIAWSLTAPSQILVDQLKALDAAAAAAAGDSSTAFEISVSEVKVKMGNGISVIPLAGNKRDGGNGIVER